MHERKALVETDVAKRAGWKQSNFERAQACSNAPKTGARGSTLTEFAFILPVMCMCLFGVIDFGRALYSFHFVSDAAREASRWASVRGKTCTDYTDACPAGESDVSDYVMSIVPPGIDKKGGALSVSTDWVRPPGVNNLCTGPRNNPGCAVQVTVTYNFKFIFPFLPTSTLRMHSTSEMIISK